ncbi:MAG: MCM DNA helicase complex subunit [Chaenotheca gracillima]|nr:MAG: MCM DNA helicase complex subunit [Chaenotheca gracillima]
MLEERTDGPPVSFAEVEIDAPDNGQLGMRYMINSIPTLLAFSRGEAQIETRVSAVRDLKDREFLKAWIEQEANRGGEGGAGGGGGGILGGLFGR